MEAKLTHSEKLDKIFSIVARVCNSHTDPHEDCSYIEPMIYALCGYHHLVLDNSLTNEISIDADFVQKWMDKCNDFNLTAEKVKDNYNKTLQEFDELENDGIVKSDYDYMYLGQKRIGCAHDEVAHN